MKAANLAIDIGRPISTFAKMRHSATLLSLWGQLGLTGRELTGQQEVEAKNHMTQFLSDVAFGSILGASGQTARGYAQVGLGTTALSLMEGNDIEDALKDGALMTALHTLGYKGRFNEINGITYKRSAATLNQYLGDVVPPVRKGQTTPNVLKLDIPAIEQMRQQMQTEYSNDPRIMNVPEIKGEYDAVDFLTRAALIKHGEIINNSIKKTDIPQEMIDAEIRRIGTAGVQLYNQTLPQEFRIQKQMQDMQSLAEQLKPQIPSEQLKQKGPSINEITQKIPLKFPEQIHIKPEGVVFPEGNIPITGYSSNIDPISKSNIENFDKARGPHVSDRIIFVNDPKTNAIMRLINFEATLKGEKSPITNPENTLRAYYIEETPTGRELKPVGYAATSERIGSREFNINKNYDEMIERIRNVIDKAESPEKLMEKLNKDKSQPKIDETMAQDLFNQKQAIKDLEDTALLTAIKATTPLEKYDVNLNNSPIAEAMRQNGLTFLTGNINKLTKTESGEPFLVLSVKDQNWLESMALRDKKPSPVQETIKEITERKKAVEITDRMKEVKQFPQKETLVTKSGIKLEKQINPDDSFWLEQNKTKIGSKWAELANKGNKIEHLMLPKNEGYAGKIRVNGKEMTYNEAETLFKKKVPPAKTLSLPFQQAKTAVKPISGTFIPPSVKSSLPEAKMTQKEADRALYKRLSAKMDEIVKKATEEGRLPEKPTEKNALNVLSKKMVELIKKYKTVGEKRFVPVNIAKEKESLMKEAMIVADDALSEAATKGGGFFEGEQKFSNQIRRSVRGAELMIRNNKLKLSSKEQKDLENEFKEKIDQKIKQETEVASREYEPNLDFEERVTQKEIPIKVIKPLLTKDQELAKTYGLKLKEDGFLFLDKNREPLFADTKRKGTPLSFFGSMLKKDLDVYNKLKTQRSEDFVKDLDNMAKTPGTYSLFAKTVKEALNEIIVTPQEPWLKKAMGESAGKSYTFNSLLNSNSNYMKNLFETINFQGHPISQSIKRIIAQVEGKSPEQIKKIDLQIIKAEEKARELREEQASDPFSGKIEGISKEELKDMSIKEQNQVEKMQDLTNFELRFPSLIYEDLTGKKPPKESVVADGIRFAKDFVSNYSPKIKSEREGGKIKKKFMGQTEWEKIRKRVLEPKKLQ